MSLATLTPSLAKLAVGTLFISVSAVAQAVRSDDEPDRDTPHAAYVTTTFDSLNVRHPHGLVVEQVAASPLVVNPIVADWDDHGRLVLVEAAGVRQGVEEQRATRPNRLVRLVDDDGDGRFDRRIVAATDLSFPEGVLCLENQILVSAPPEIWSFLDGDGDGVCERREIWFDGKTLTYCANDLHGPYLGLDGWIYWCKGAFAEQVHERTQGERLTSRAAHILRRRPEGGPVEIVMTGGMDNPVEVAFSPQGERFFTSTFLQHPANGLRDGIAHAVYGSVFGKEHSVIDGHWRTGPLMPIMTHLGPAAPSGLMSLKELSILEGLLPVHEEDTVLVAAQFNLQKVSAHRLEPQGASYRTTDLDILVGDRIDFHPTDVLEDANGSLLVIDTGGWYDLCCPSSGVDQRRATGGIYRVTRAGLPSIREARGQADFRETPKPADRIVEAADSRWWIRQRALRHLCQNADDAVPVLSGIVNEAQWSYRARLDALWSLCRIGNEAALKVLEQQLDNSDSSFRHAALNTLSVHRHGQAQQVARLLDASEPLAVRRAAAEVLGRIADPSASSYLLTASSSADVDRILEHSILFALMEQKQTDHLLAELKKAGPQEQSFMLRALTQIAPNEVDPAFVFQSMRSPSSTLSQVARDIVRSHPSWSQKLRVEVRELWKRSIDHSPDREILFELFQSWGPREELLSLIEEALFRVEGSGVDESTALALSLMTQFPSMDITDSWVKPLCVAIPQLDPKDQVQIARWFSQSRVTTANAKELVDMWIGMAMQKGVDRTRRLELLGAIPQGTFLPLPMEEEVIEALLQTHSPIERQLADRVISRVRLTTTGANLMALQLHRVEPLQFSGVLDAIGRSECEDADFLVFKFISTFPAAKTIPKEQYVRAFQSRSAEVRAKFEAMVADLFKPPEDIDRALDQWEESLPLGDVQRGLQVFRSSRAACSACHTVGYVGGNIGPDMTRIGATRTKRDLLEAILFPSVRFAQSYQPQQVLTHNGEVFNGLVASSKAEAIELILSADRRVRIPVEEIAQSRPSQVSIMPAGLETVLSKEDLADLLAFLQSAR